MLRPAQTLVERQRGEGRAEGGEHHNTSKRLWRRGEMEGNVMAG